MSYEVVTICTDHDGFTPKFLICAGSVRHLIYGRIKRYIMTQEGNVMTFDREVDAIEKLVAIKRGFKEDKP